MQKILLVDDELDILDFLSYNLKKESYEVFTASGGKEAIEVALKQNPDLIILDIMMPGMNGIETCAEIRNTPQLKSTRIAFLTARNEDYTQIAGFDAGADDYIQKPIKPKVFLSRIKALLRRNAERPNTETIEIGNLQINRERYMVKKENVEIALPRKEFELLFLLAGKPGKVFTREEILAKVWGDEIVVGDRTIDVHIRKLREKIGEEFIKTIKGVGYKFEF